MFLSLGSVEVGMGMMGTVPHSQFCPHWGLPRIVEVGGHWIFVGLVESGEEKGRLSLV